MTQQLIFVNLKTGKIVKANIEYSYLSDMESCIRSAPFLTPGVSFLIGLDTIEEKNLGVVNVLKSKPKFIMDNVYDLANVVQFRIGNLELTINPKQRDEFMEWVMKNNFIDDLYGNLHGWKKVHVQNPDHECVFNWF